MFVDHLILLLFFNSINPSSCSNITSELAIFLKDNGCNYVTVVWTKDTRNKQRIAHVRTPYEEDGLAEEIFMKTSKAMYTRIINAGLIEYRNEGFNIFPITLKKKQVLNITMRDIGATRVQHSLVVATETWSKSDLGMFLEFVKQDDQDLMFYLVIPSAGDGVSWYQILTMRSGIVINRIDFVAGSRLIKNQNFNLQGLHISAITSLSPAFGLSSLDGCMTIHETDIVICEQLEGYFSDMIPLLQRELNFTYDLFLEHNWGMGPVSGILTSFLRILSTLICYIRQKNLLSYMTRRKNG